MSHRLLDSLSQSLNDSTQQYSDPQGYSGGQLSDKSSSNVFHSCSRITSHAKEKTRSSASIDSFSVNDMSLHRCLSHLVAGGTKP
ncbi:unnamed protein product [Arabis nemorensis]|uniref:Uncharacterized protein n=1 Tax=Arabis nemorensis TaxID=586526 RepID=A0A565CT30_9BRAS|nr:unnamed protein product [Arabis nemorensis]